MRGNKLSLDDTVTVTVKVTGKNQETQRVTLECQGTNQRGEVVISGTAEVIAPQEKRDQSAHRIINILWLVLLAHREGDSPRSGFSGQPSFAQGRLKTRVGCA